MAISSIIDSGVAPDPVTRLNTQLELEPVSNEELITLLSSRFNDTQPYQRLLSERPHLFSGAQVYISTANFDKQLNLIKAITEVIELPTYQQRVLAYAPAIAQFSPKAWGVFLGYDFHVGAKNSLLIEINTNAGGGLLSALLIQLVNDRQSGSDSTSRFAEIENSLLAMFRQEWTLERGNEALKVIAIVDSRPAEQYLLPEFLLFKDLFERHRIQTVICDPAELSLKNGRLYYGNTVIDLVYNRHTDFSFAAPELTVLAEAYLSRAAVITPHPRAHALYADKRNLTILSDPKALQELGVATHTAQILLNGIAPTRLVRPEDAEDLWANRKNLFFKPAKGYGSKAAYRGDKLTQRVFAEILEGNYVAQRFVPPSLRHLQIAGKPEEFKWDMRQYVYHGHAQLRAARLYQGQTTNFRTPGGGFAEVLEVDA